MTSGLTPNFYAAKDPTLLGLDALFEESDVPMLLVDAASGITLRANHASLVFLERNPAEVLGRTTTELGLWTNSLARRRLVRQFHRDGVLRRQPINVLTGRGTVRRATLNILLFTHAGRPLLLKRFTVAEPEFQRSRLSHADALRLISHGPHKGIPDWRFLLSVQKFTFSPKALVSLGWPAEDQPAASFPLVHAADFKMLLKSIQHAAEDGVGVSTTVRLLLGHLEYRWFELRGDLLRRPSRTSHGEASDTEVGGLLRDVHATHERKLARRREAERAILAIEGTGVGTWETFPDETAIWDDQTYHLYGYDPGTKKPSFEIYREAVSDQEFQRTSKWLTQALRQGLKTTIEFQVRWPNGELHWLAAKGRQLQDESGRVLSLLGINWDVSEQRRAREVLLAHQRELSRLAGELMHQEQLSTRKLAMALHDGLGQTLVAMRLQIDRHLNAGHGANHPVRIMDRLVNSAVTEVRELLENLRPHLLEELGLGAALDNEIARLNQQLQSPDLVLLPSSDAMTMRWPAEVEYAFFMVARECISNARRHAHAGLVKIELAAPGMGLIMEVVDDGIGFSPDARKPAPGHLGMIGMRERANAIGARLTIASASNEGTRVSMIWSPDA